LLPCRGAKEYVVKGVKDDREDRRHRDLVQIVCIVVSLLVSLGVLWATGGVALLFGVVVLFWPGLVLAVLALLFVFAIRPRDRQRPPLANRAESALWRYPPSLSGTLTCA
jgi:hypothetical protein